MTIAAPGPVALLGSGETGPVGGAVYERLARRVSSPRIAVLETPAGFQPNSARVAARIAEVMGARLRGYRPRIDILPARRREGPAGTEDPEATAPLLAADLIFLGPGSPTYAARQLRDSLAWRRLVARHRRGAALVTASAATIALGAFALPVYEIYKVGAELHWQPGLDLFGLYGLSLVFLPHWNNAEGGAELDTSRCFMGRERYAGLVALLPPATTVVGIDEHTVLLVDLHAGIAEVSGRGAVTIARGGEEDRVASGETLVLSELGPFHPADPAAGVPPEVWAELDAVAAAQPPAAPATVCALVEERQAARARRDWAAADTLRRQLAELGWQVRDTPEGPRLGRLEGQPGPPLAH
ncbi:MAG TPA: hypothetical protein PKD53_20310 [Chloroflexaceae bacterium]|nr:hypothetical protein [Chloroflexaceae bacterium]